MAIAFGDPRLPPRFWDKVYPEPNTGCWLWGAATSKGYGRYNHQRQGRWAYVVSYAELVGPVPEGLELDHLCRQPACVYPEHLEPVTHLVNVARGDAWKHWKARTHCTHGHEFTPGNTRLRKDGGRDCKECDRRRGGVYSRTDKGKARARDRARNYQQRKRNADTSG